MGNAAEQLEVEDFVQQMGTVSGAEQDLFVVDTPHGELRAKRAASCLLQPRPGDRVLVAVGVPRTRVAPGTGYVLAVLEREAAAPNEIALDGDLQIRLPTGRLGVAAESGIELRTPGDLSMSATKMELGAVEGRAVFDRLSVLGAELTAQLGKVKLFAEALDSVLERSVQRVKRAYRFVKESDQVRAGRVDYSANQGMLLHGHNTVITANELVKVDGDQIHVG